MTERTTGSDPIRLELVRARLEAAAEEGALAIEQTAVSPVVAEGKDFSTNIFTAGGKVLVGGGKVEAKWASARNAVREVMERHGATVAPGDVFAANDPHHGGGNHPQDIEIVQPVYVGEDLVGWIAASAHLIDVGGMAFGSWAPDATECYQEALRFPPVRLLRAGAEQSDVWSMILNNVRLPKLVEMDIRGLVAGCAVTGAKLGDVVTSMGVDEYERTVEHLCRATETILRERISAIEPGEYSMTGWVEWAAERIELSCRLTVDGDRLHFDFSDAPPQVSHFINSKAYIVHGEIVADVRSQLGQDLPFCDGIFQPVSVTCPEGSVLDSTEPAPVGSAHLDVAMCATVLAIQCLQSALAATPADRAAQLFNGPAGVISLATHSWSYTNPDGTIDGLVVNESWQAGSSAGVDRDGSDLFPLLVGTQNVLDFVDVEVFEAWYPIEIVEKRCSPGPYGAGRYRAGAGCQLAYRVTTEEGAVGAMLAMRDGIPMSGVAGGDPGAPTEFRIVRADGTATPLAAHQQGVRMGPQDVFVMRAGSGGGWGDPLDRDLEAVAEDVGAGRITPADAAHRYGALVGATGEVDERGSSRLREQTRRDRLAAAVAPETPMGGRRVETPACGETWPLYHGIVQVGARAVAAASGAVLAESPAHWTDGCPVLEEQHESRQGGGWITRRYLDPLSGACLHAEAVPAGTGRALSTYPRRWLEAAAPH